MTNRFSPTCEVYYVLATDDGSRFFDAGIKNDASYGANDTPKLVSDVRLATSFYTKAAAEDRIKAGSPPGNPHLASFFRIAVVAKLDISVWRA